MKKITVPLSYDHFHFTSLTSHQANLQLLTSSHQPKPFILIFLSAWFLRNMTEISVDAKWIVKTVPSFPRTRIVMRPWPSPHPTLLTVEIQIPNQVKRDLTAGIVERVDIFTMTARNRKRSLWLHNLSLQIRSRTTRTMRPWRQWHWVWCWIYAQTGICM